MRAHRTAAGTRTALAAAALGSLLLAACTPTQPPPQTAGGISLELFDSCDDLLAHLKAEASERVTAWGLESGGYVALAAGAESAASDGAADMSGGAGGGADFSGTNNQVEGVDEADVVKTNGEVIVTSISGKVRVIDVSTAEVVSTIEVPGLEDGSSELLLDGDDLVVVSTQWYALHGGNGGGERTSITRVDISDPANPTIVGTTRVEGTYRSARMIDGTVRLVLVSQPAGLVFSYPEDGSMAAEADALEANKQVVAESTIDDWLPHRQPVDAAGNGGTPELLLGCNTIGRPGEVSGFSTVSVVTLPAGGDATPSSAAGVLANGDTVYASTDRVIVATSPWQLWGLDDTTTAASTTHTDLHSFDISRPDATRYVASGRVEGWLLNQFSIDETDGVVRVATTLTPPSSGQASSSSLIVLTEDGDELTETGRLDGLGKTEQIYSVRYLGPDLAAVVTFRQTDPLYLVDTSDPTDPVALGELKIPGYSAYLHPLGDDLLLGIGQDATEEGQTTGLQASLFDISDASDPQRIGQVSWPDTSSAAEWDHRAFLLWEDRVYLPAETYDWDGEGEGKPQIGLVTADLDGASLTEGPRVDTAGEGDPWAGGVSRVLVVGDHLWAIGWSDIFRFDLDTLDGGPVAVI